MHQFNSLSPNNWIFAWKISQSLNFVIFPKWPEKGLKPLKPILTLPSPYIFPRKCDVVYSNVITNDVICAPFVTSLLKRSGETKNDIALVHLCDFRHCIPALQDRRLCDKSNYYWLGLYWNSLSSANFRWWNRGFPLNVLYKIITYLTTYTRNAIKFNTDAKAQLETPLTFGIKELDWIKGKPYRKSTLIPWFF